MIEERQIDTGRGTATVDVVVCDRCGAEAAKESATGWARVQPVGLILRTLADFPELVVCSWPCLRAVDRSFPLNDSPQA